MFESWLVDWLHLVVRWTHIVVGAAWIGASFYFNWLNNHVRPPEHGPSEPGVKGELMAVHGGAFYKVMKFGGAPEKLPSVLHWFKFEAYFTWITGILLVGLVYWAQAKAFLIDTAVVDLSPAAAIAISASVLVGGWLVYDQLCKSPLAKTPSLLAAVGFALVGAVSFGLTHVFAARAAYIHVGAMLGTMMAANVFFVIIPGQRAMVDALIVGQPPDIAKGAAGSLRSLHNNYLTLPVLFLMVSNHFPVTYGNPHGWLVLLGVIACGFVVRHWQNENHHGRAKNWWLAAATAAFVLIAGSTYPVRPAAADTSKELIKSSKIQQIVAQRCVSCHSSEPWQPGWPEAPKGLKFDSMTDITTHLDKIEQMAVTTHTMPLGNLTQMTDEERLLLGEWIQQQRAK